MATQPHTLVTAEQFYQLPQEEGREFELLDGEVIEMSSPTPTAQLVAHDLGGKSLLYPALRGRGEVIPETDFSDGRFTTCARTWRVFWATNTSQLDLETAAGHRSARNRTVEVDLPLRERIRVERGLALTCASA